MSEFETVTNQKLEKMKTRTTDYNPVQQAFDTPVVRHSALEWWLTLSSASKTRLCDIHTELVGSIRRWETLTGREVQMIYESEHCA